MSLFGLLRLPASIVFGSGQRAVVAPTVARLGSRALVCTDARLGREPVFHTLLNELAQAGVTDESVRSHWQPDLADCEHRRVPCRCRHLQAGRQSSASAAEAAWIWRRPSRC